MNNDNYNTLLKKKRYDGIVLPVTLIIKILLLGHNILCDL